MKHQKGFVTSIGAVTLFVLFALLPAKITSVHSAGAQGPQKPTG